MSRRCEITGAKASTGSVIRRSGLAKKKGGIGMHITAVNKRKIDPNLKRKRIFVPELGRTVTVRLTARALKTMAKNGPYKVLKEAGLV